MSWQFPADLVLHSFIFPDIAFSIINESMTESINAENRLYTERTVILDTIPGQRVELFPIFSGISYRLC
ncbi:hypothetical protein Lepto7375DRAFT_5149 [Leptolyngbya sp. PCC 7375]|nr:hypothetical protein Lepto7375DRAFT_5149 [Leptolyngbya sp. PCC 7375]